MLLLRFLPSLMLPSCCSTDTECFTLLHFDSPGLEILNSQSGLWTELPSSNDMGGSWVVIFGDAFSILANGRISATYHRVRRLPLPRPRTSLVAFVATDRLVEPPAAFGPPSRSHRNLEDWWSRAVTVSGALL